MTLVELLVVIIILTTIVAAAIPIMAPADDDRRGREASRGLNTFIMGAQARAIALNRPYGVALKRLSQDTKRDEDNGVCLEVFYIEQAPPYSGFDANSRACVALHPDPPTDVDYPLVLIRFLTRGTTGANLPSGWMPDLFPTGMIRPGDIIEISGTRFELQWLRNDQQANVKLDANGVFFEEPANGIVQISARPVNDSGQQINPKYDDRGNELGSVTPSPAPYWTSPAPYKILRQPTPTSDEPYQLPEGTAIDLRASGVGIDDYFYVSGMNDNSQGVLIMYAPEGRIARVSYSQSPPNTEPPFDTAVVDNVYLLVGKRENIPAPAASIDPTLSSSGLAAASTDEQRAELRAPVNWLNGTSRWVVLGSQSGRVVTIENAFADPLAIFAEFTATPKSLSQSSEELRNQQILAAREFTREMRQVGGR